MLFVLVWWIFYTNQNNFRQNYLHLNSFMNFLRFLNQWAAKLGGNARGLLEIIFDGPLL